MTMRQAEQDALPQVLGAHGAVSRAAFHRRVQALRAVLDLHPARRWALICDDAGWFGAGLLALAGRGRSIVLPQAPQAGALQDLAVDAVFTDRPGDFAGMPLLAVAEPGDDFNAPPPTPDDAIRVEFYTSGSSGFPKCVPKAFAQLRLEVAALERQWGPRLGSAQVAGTVPHHHLYGLLFRVLWPLSTGRPFHSEMCLQPGELRATVGPEPCVIVSSPAFLSRVQAVTDLPPAAQVSALFSSGAPLPDDVARGMQEEWGQAAIEVYGSTETGGIGWRAWDGAERRPWWRPIEGVVTEIREEEAGPRLWAKSGCTWRQDWMPSGDLARYGSDARFALLGRADDVLKFEDKRLSLSEMRAQLLSHPWVAEARLLLLPGKRQQIGAVVVLKSAGRAILEQEGKRALQERLREALSVRYETLLLPRKWRFPDALPDNAMGKTEQARLLALFEAFP
ncbi:MAG TPA: AMP-binding protein [Gammaproteobacteria bacterium]|jgi:acyl-coenzyme A synthetase/AMP-(fatty) acid ligase|nr:AMP-binding protein [Gammaproteobacteria bacterium]